jgi:hypothetical protein
MRNQQVQLTVFLHSFLLFVLINTNSPLQAQEPWVHIPEPQREVFVSVDGDTINEVVDYSGNGYTGVFGFQGIPNTEPVSVDGLVNAPTGDGRALCFDGVDDCVSLLDGVVSWGSDYTIEAWIVTTMTKSNIDVPYPIIGHWASGSASGCGQAFGLNDGRLVFVVSEDASSGCGDDRVEIKGSQVNDGLWHHVAVTVDQTADLVTLYVDGQHAGQGSIARISNSGCGIRALQYIGSTGSNWDNWTRQFFAGTIDELRIYSGVLSAGKITTHFNHGVGQYGQVEPNLLAGWHFDESAAGSTDTAISLDSAMALARPGDLIWILEGDYIGPFTFTRDGSRQRPIVYRAFPGDRVRIIGGLTQQGAYNYFWGLEITDPDGLGVGKSAIEADAPGLHVINCTIHHTYDQCGIGAWSRGPDHVYYGNIIHDAGKGNIQTTCWPHGVYTQNDIDKDGVKYFVNNVIMNNDANSSSNNFTAYTQEGVITGFHVEKNVFANRRFLIGGFNRPADQEVVIQNYFYQATCQFGYRRPTQAEFRDNYLARSTLSIEWFWGEGETLFTQVAPNVFTGNVILSPPQHHIKFRTSAYLEEGRREGYPAIQATDIFDDNVYSSSFRANFHANDTELNDIGLSRWRTATAEAGNAFDTNSTMLTDSRATKVVLLPNEYESGRAHLVIFNWERLSDVQVDLSPALPVGSPFSIRDATSAYGTPIVSGTYNGVVRIPIGKEEFRVLLVTPFAPEPKSSVAEGFETSDFSACEWVTHGDADWTVTSAESHSGIHSAQAGSIDDNETTTLSLTLDCTSKKISFYYKVSSESGFDHLGFYIDGTREQRWSGEKDWTEVSFPVTAGRRTFEWVYSKDGSVSSGADTAWIDDIAFPID